MGSRPLTGGPKHGSDMSADSPATIVRAIKSAHDRIMTILGVTFGVLLLVYFFTFAQLVDRGYMGLVWFEAVTSVLLVIGLFRLKHLSFRVVKLVYGGRQGFGSLLDALEVADLDKDEESILKRIAPDGGSR